MYRDKYTTMLSCSWQAMNDFNFDLRHRLCDIEKAYAAMVGAFSNVVTFGGARGIKRVGKPLL